MTIAASGELGDNPEIHLWNSRTTAVLCIFKDVHRKGISSLQFSDSGDVLVSLGQDIYHSFTVFRSPGKNWTDGIILYASTVSLSRMLWVLYNESSEFPLVIGGN